MNKISKFVVGAVAALAFTFVLASSASAAYMHTGTLKQGSKGTQVLALQQTLNMTSCKVAVSGAGSMGMETTTFGPATKAAVKCFQAANGLTADGVVGSMSGAKLALVTSTGVNTGLPAGCVSTSGYSTVNGAPCSGTPGTTVFPAGCVSSVGYSSTTGQPCSSTSTGVVVGGPLSINTVTANSGYANTNVGVGTTDKQIADLRIVSGAGGSGNLTGLNVTITNAGTGDFQFTKYASNVSVWYNGVNVGSLPASSFTQYNSAFSAYIPLNGAILAPNTTSDLYIAVSALPVIDSVNTTSTNVNNFVLSNVSLRYSDSTGSAFQYSVPGVTFTGASNVPVANALANTNFTFATASSANNIKLNVTKDLNDSIDHTVQVSQSSNTQGVTLATINLNAQGSNLTIQRLPVTIGVGSAIADVSNAISTVSLYNAAGVKLDSQSILVGSTAACPAGSSLNGVGTSKCVTVNFQNFASTGSGVNGFPLTAGQSTVFTIKADINTVNGSTFSAGTYAVAELTPANVTSIQAYDAFNNLIQQNTTYLVGSTTGSKTFFYVNGVNVTAANTPSISYSNPGAAQTSGLFSMTIPFSVASYGTTAYIPNAATLSGTCGTPSGSNAVRFCVDNNGAPVTGATANVTYAGSDTLNPVNGNYQIPVGQTKTFNLTITYKPGTFGSYRATLLDVPYSTLSTASTNTGDITSGYVDYTAGLNTNTFRTAYLAGQ